MERRSLYWDGALDASLHLVWGVEKHGVEQNNRKHLVPDYNNQCIIHVNHVFMGYFLSQKNRAVYWEGIYMVWRKNYTVAILISVSLLMEFDSP